MLYRRCLILLTFLLEQVDIHSGEVSNVPQNAVCEWPECVPRCTSCDYGFVSTCGGLFQCHESDGPNFCFLSRCICSDGYCPTNKKKNGEFSKCEPKVCFPGARPPQHIESRIAKIFVALSFGEPFPSELLNITLMNSSATGFSDILKLESFHTLATAVLWPAAALLCVGILLAITMLLYVCFMRVEVRALMGGSLEIAAEKFIENGDLQMVKVRSNAYNYVSDWQSRPLVWPLLTSASITLIASVVIIGMQAYPNLTQIVDVIESDLEDAYNDAVTLSEEGLVVRDTSEEFHVSLQRVDHSCKLALFLANVNSTADLALNYLGLIHTIHTMLESAPEVVATARRILKLHRENLSVLPWLPSAIISILCLIMVIEALAVSICHSSAIAFGVDCTLRGASVLFAAVLILMTLVAAGEVSALCLLSVFCHNVDENVVRLVEKNWGSSGLAANVTSHYILGEGYNPLMQISETADRYIAMIADEYSRQELKINITSAIAMCPLTQFIDISSMATKARAVLYSQTKLLETRHIYPYYQTILREGVCYGFINSIGWILLSQLVIGIFCFPLCIILTHRFLSRWAIWEWAVEASQADSGAEESSVLTRCRDGCLVREDTDELELEVPGSELRSSPRARGFFTGPAGSTYSRQDV